MTLRPPAAESEARFIASVLRVPMASALLLMMATGVLLPASAVLLPTFAVLLPTTRLVAASSATVSHPDRPMDSSWAQSAQSALSAQSAQPAQSAQSAQSALPAQSAQPAQSALPAQSAPDDSSSGVPVRIASWVYGRGKAGKCFNDAFLAELARRSHIQVDRKLHPVAIESGRLFDYPMSIWAGNQAFELSEAQQARLRRYIEQGGFVLVSAGCASQPFAASFRRAWAETFDEATIKPLPMSHAIFDQLTRIDRVITRRRMDGPAIFGLWHDGQLVGIFSPVGLHDNETASGPCCCCGANEVVNARIINASVLAYVLTH